ncbi:type II toxin-antitoxin system HicB family antitoxin [bacterium]|nr:type II toxin-antitoxin system HicB family antitoxin [bacterium]
MQGAFAPCFYIMNKANTKNSGIARTIIFPYKKGFLAVCLDFDIIEEGETREILEGSIREAVVGYIECVRKCNLSDKLLNRHADKRYWKIYELYLNLISNKAKKPTSSNLKKTSLFVYPIGKTNEEEKHYIKPSSMLKEIKKLRIQFPNEINVLIRRGDNGTYCAEVTTFKGCFTVGDTILELINMVNDAVRAYLDVPMEYLPFMPVYLPKDKIKGAWRL